MGLLYPLEVMRLRNDAGLRHNVLGATYGKDVRREADGTAKPHQGWDLYAKQGTPIYAVADGIVAWTANGGDYGRQILLQFNRDASMTSGEGTVFAFHAHLKEVLVSKGDVVKGGQKIGLTGISGNADAKYPHLHFELRTTDNRQGGLKGRLDPSSVYGGALISCRSEQIGGIDTVKSVSIEQGKATPVPGTAR